MDHIPGMFDITPTAIYSFDYLRSRLESIVSLPTLLDRSGLKQSRKFRDALTGQEILDGLARVRPYSETDASVVDMRSHSKEPLRKLTMVDIESR